MTRNLEELAKLNREIEAIRAGVQRQRELVVRLSTSGADTDAAEKLLSAMLEKLQDAEDRRDKLARP